MILTGGIEGKALRTEASPRVTVSTGSLAVRSRQLVTQCPVYSLSMLYYLLKLTLQTRKVNCFT